MSINVFIQERSGNYNWNHSCYDTIHAQEYVEEIHKAGGYWCDLTFIPWHRIDFIKVEMAYGKD